EERVRALTKALINAQETERRKLALDLHDEVAQQLSAFRMFLEPVRLDLAVSQPEMAQEVARVSKMAKDLVEHVRDLSYALRPSTLDSYGLVATLSQYCTDYSKMNKIKVNFFPSGMEKVTLDFDSEINLFRLAQEALTNVKKHANARVVTIKLQALQPYITLSVEDNGTGFDVPGEAARKMGQKKMGLWSMEQRATLLGGRLSIQSKPGKGTRVFVKIPLRVNGHESQEANPDR
ncbi:MAG: sensor histidine kinase, partial [Thermodesulfobacteriota bacterium]